ncbi:class I SAM-dependent DNA methyltransferase [Tateyamaria omphalii]|uniref:Methyltransferase n=1 Tax=Tateyamaria omphalii TaxID=299262 RepID=A0A1P8MY80_9RHOB|nr:methyltransferase domain-containing protein [Tateyamaria omphalii]APX13045.1 methyltransferase [Tateyamaria omphalii]
MTKDPSLDAAYALETPDDSKRLYAAWAGTYDSDFARNSDYILPEQVARHFVNIGGFGPVLDVGAGTGLCGAALQARGIENIDGTDISADMLEVARAKGIYRATRVENILNGLATPDGPYQGAVSSGTFTNGHVGPDGIAPLLAAVRSAGRIVISVNAQHYATSGFDAELTRLETAIDDLTTTEVAIYGPAATGDHARDTALLIAFRKA